MIKLREQIPAEVCRKFRLWHEHAIGTYNYLKHTRPAPSRDRFGNACNGLLALRIRKLRDIYFP